MMGQLNNYPGIWGSGAVANQTEVAGLLTRIQEAYGIQAFRIKPFGPVWKLSAPDGEYGLKPLKLSVEQIRDLAGTLEKLRSGGFSHLARLLTTTAGTPSLSIGGRNYTLSPWYDGANPDFRNPEHLIRVARLFGKMHSISAQWVPGPGTIRQAGILKFRDRVEFLNRIFEVLSRESYSTGLNRDGNRPRRRQWNRIDRGILRVGPHFLAQAAVSVRELSKSSADYGLADLLPAGFCHHDPAPRNLILHRGELILIDFELSGPDLFISELATLLDRSLESNQWNQDIFELMIKAYQLERPLSPVEIQLLPYLLLFPQRFWRICRQRYHEDLQWTEKRFARRFHRIMDQEIKRVNCLTRLTEQGLEDLLDFQD